VSSWLAQRLSYHPVGLFEVAAGIYQRAQSFP
jgi:hypothetical protein